MGKKLSSFNEITEVVGGYKVPLFTGNIQNFWVDSINLFKSKVTNYKGVTTSITAYAGGGQANATALTGEFNNVATVASLGDSVLLDNAVVGKRMVVYNNGAKSMDVYPKTGEIINGLSANIAFRIAPSDYLDVTCYATGTWVLNKYEYLFRRDIVTADVLNLNSSPVEVFKAISGLMAKVEYVGMAITYNSTTYATNTTLVVGTDTATAFQWQGTGILASTLTANKIFASPITAAAGETQLIANKMVYVREPSGNPTTGNSGITIFGKVNLLKI